ncbi:MAG TPA: ABC transporter ATP-binding protein [Gemmatimonadaceae bacterium]
MLTSSRRAGHALSVRGIGKAYNVANRQSTTLAESVSDWVGRARTGRKRDQFWALQDVTCDIEQGEILGLVGRNGAGKSTLLKIIAGVTAPTTGAVDVYGRIGSMLEVGTGFHPELTGRENVFLNGAFIGMRRAEIRSRFDEIVEFSGVSDFLDVPIKRFSSGMQVRLAFAVAAHLDADILLVDEVLAVGDQAFQDKCLGKMKEVRQKEGRTVLFVSHNLAAVANLCTRALLLSGGRVIADASASEITRLYSAGVAIAATTDDVDLTQLPRSKPAAARCTSIRVNAVAEDGTPLDGITRGCTLEVAVTVQATDAVNRALLGVEAMDERGRPAFGVSTDTVDAWIDLAAGDRRTVVVRLRNLQIRPGLYTVGLTLTTVTDMLDELDAVVRFEVTPEPGAGYERWPGWPAAAYAPRFSASVG